MKTQNQFIKLVATQTLAEYGIRMTSNELKLLVSEKMNYEIPQSRWNQVVQEISEVSGIIMENECTYRFVKVRGEETKIEKCKHPIISKEDLRCGICDMSKADMEKELLL